jgi:hypothetical protein
MRRIAGRRTDPAIGLGMVLAPTSLLALRLHGRKNLYNTMA